MTHPQSRRSGSARAASAVQEKIDALRQLANAHLTQMDASMADFVRPISEAMLDIPLIEFLKTCDELEQAHAGAVAAPAPPPPAHRDPSHRQSIQVRARPSMGGAALADDVAELDPNSLALNIRGTLLTVPLGDDGSGDQAAHPLAALPNLDEAARRKIDAKMRELRALLAAELGGSMAENTDG